MSEQRRCLRFNIELPVCFKNIRHQKDLSIATTINVSAKGLCILTREALEVGQQLLMQVKLPQEDRAIVNTQVMWVKEKLGVMPREYEIGVRLVEPMQHDEPKLVKFCAQKMLESYNQYSASQDQSEAA